MVIYKQLFVFWILMYTCLLTEGIVYLGCYEDHRKPNRVLPDQQGDNDSTNTPEDCARRCSQYRYAGVESGEECFCGNTMNNPQERPKSECDDPCPGDGSKMCGGDWMISVYTNWATTTTSTTSTSSHDTSSESPSTATPPINSPAASTTSSPTTVPSPSSFTSSTSGNSSTSDKPVAAFKDSSQGDSPAATSAGVSVAVALAIAAFVIVFVLRKRGNLCFAITKRSTLENTDDNHHISLARKESKQNDDYQSQGAPVSNRINCGVQKKRAMKTDKYYAVVGNNCASTESTPNCSYPGNMCQEIDTNATNTGIDDSRQDNSDYDYTNKSFNSNTEISDNVYNHLKSAGDEYDYVGKGQSNVNAMENNYDITSGDV